MEQPEIKVNQKRYRMLLATIREKHLLTTRGHADPVEDPNEEKLREQIATLVREIHPDFLFPKEYTGSADDVEKGMYEYRNSPLARAIKFGDNETAAIIIHKEGITPKHFVIKGEVPSFEQAISEANEEIAGMLLQRVAQEESISAQTKAQYKKDFLATFGESPLMDALQIDEPKEKGKLRRL